MVLPNSAQKQNYFTNKIFVVKLPATHFSCYDFKFHRRKFHDPAQQTHENFQLQNFMVCAPQSSPSFPYGGRHRLRRNTPVNVMVQQLCAWVSPHEYYSGYVMDGADT